MSLAHLLEDFGSASDSGSATTVFSDVAVEDLRLAAFEQGYSAGWDDAIKVQRDQQKHLSEALAGRLDDLSFTYQEARVEMMKSVIPLLRAFVDKVLPEALNMTLAANVFEALREMAYDRTDLTAELRIPAQASAALKSILTRETALPVSLIEDETLEEGQVHLKLGQLQRAVDVTGLVSEMRSAVEAFESQTQSRRSTYG